MGKLVIASRYGIAPNELLNDAKLSFKAKGIWTYLQSKPDGWQFSAERIALDASDGLSSVKAGLKELEDAGLLKRNRFQNEKGFWLCDYILSMPTVDNPANENPTCENPTEDNPTTNKERYSNKDFSNKEESNTRAEEKKSAPSSDLKNSEKEKEKSSAKKEKEAFHTEIRNSNLFRSPVIPTYAEVEEYIVGHLGGTKQMAKSFFDRNEGLGWFFKNSPVTNFRFLANNFVAVWQQNEDKKTKQYANNRGSSFNPQHGASIQFDEL